MTPRSPSHRAEDAAAPGDVTASGTPTAELPSREDEIDAVYFGSDPVLHEELVRLCAATPRLGALLHVRTAEQAQAAAQDGRRPVLVRLDLDDPAVPVFLRGRPNSPVLGIVDVEDLEELDRWRRQTRDVGVLDVLPRHELTPALFDSALRWVLERHAHALELQQQITRFSLAVESTRDGFWEWDLEHDRVFFSARYKEILGLPADALGEDLQGWIGRVHPLDVARVRADLDDLRRANRLHHQLEYRMQAGDGSWRWVVTHGTALASEGRVLRVAGSLTDTTPTRRQVEELREESRRDALTRLPRQEAFMQHLARAVELARDHRDFHFGVLMVEVDRFRQLSEAMGTRADRVLGELAALLRSVVGEEDVVARLEGARFGILLQGLAKPEDAADVAKRLLAVQERPFDIDGEPVYLVLSVGLTDSTRSYTTPAEVLADAIAAASRVASREPQRRTQVFSTQMRIDAMSSMRLEMSLRRAVERSEFVLFYQPIVDLHNRQLLGFEALIRWQHPARGLVSPAEFIPIAEQTGMIVPMGRWALREAIQQISIWRAQPGGEELVMSVNLSARQVDDGQLLHTILTSLEEFAVPPEALHLELTESELVEHARSVTELLTTLRAHGVRIFMDDFGTGYSSLGYLARFPVDGLKIDRTFVDALDGHDSSARMVRTILALASSFGLDVVAEGVESDTQRAQLSALGCRMAQGFLWSRPVPAPDANPLVHARRV